MNQLKPCPFCGREVKITQEDCYGYKFPENEYMICCDSCGLQFGFAKCYDEYEITKAWNNY